MSDSAQLLASQILTVVATSVAAITIARTLEPSDWAVISALLGLSVALTLVADFGIGTWLLRELSGRLADEEQQAPERMSRLVGAGVVVNVLVALPLLIGAIVWSILARPGWDVVAALVSLLVYGALIASANALEALLRARRRVRLVLSASLIEKSVLVILLLGAAASDAGLAAIGFAYLAAGLTRIVFDGLVLFAHDKLPMPRPSIRAATEVARASLPFALNAASLNLVPRLDTLVLVSLSTTSAAWFAVGDRLLGPALIVPTTLGSALYPFMATHAAKRASPWVLAGGMGLAGLVIAVAGIVVAPFLVPLVFGSDYEEAIPVVQVMLLGIPFVYATAPLLVIAYSHRRERSLLLPVLGISVIGTLAIVVGQALGGAVAAGAGVVVRFALLFVAIAAVSLVAWRGHMRQSAGGTLSASHHASAQTP